MEPFNIEINYSNNEIVLTILEEHKYFLIIYYGAIFGAIRQSKLGWEEVDAEDIIPGHLPLYEIGADDGRVEPEFDNEFLTQVASKLEQELSKTA